MESITNEDIMKMDVADVECIGPDQEILNGFMHLNLKLKAKLLKQNIEGVSLTNKQVGHVSCKFMKTGKFTIVELARNGKHYHGLSSRANCDSSNWFTGVAVAFNRAFDSMVESEMLTKESKHKELFKILLGNVFCSEKVPKNEVLIVSAPLDQPNFMDEIMNNRLTLGPVSYLR